VHICFEVVDFDWKSKTKVGLCFVKSVFDRDVMSREEEEIRGGKMRGYKEPKLAVSL
jgi:hypothetical protein